MSPEDQADIDAIKAEQSGFSDAGPALDDALGPPAASPPELFADWQKVFPGATAAPDQEKMQAYLSALAGEIDPDVKAKIQAIYDKHFGQPSVPPEDQPEVDAIKQQAVAPRHQGDFPNAPGLDSMPLSAQEQLLKNWQTHLVHTPGHKDNLVKLKALYDQHFGGQAAPRLLRRTSIKTSWTRFRRSPLRCPTGWTPTPPTKPTATTAGCSPGSRTTCAVLGSPPRSGPEILAVPQRRGQVVDARGFLQRWRGRSRRARDEPTASVEPQQAKDDWLSIWTGDQDTWENQGLDDPLTAKAYVEAILKDKSDGNHKVPEMKAWFAKYFGSGSKDLVLCRTTT